MHRGNFIVVRSTVAQVADPFVLTQWPPPAAAAGASCLERRETEAPERRGGRVLGGVSWRQPASVGAGPAGVMAQLSNFNLVQDGFVDGIYHFLWQKIAQKSCPNVSIPDTIVYKYRQPAYWYFMSVDGTIKMKAQKNIINAKIFEAFSKQRPDAVTDIVAYYISPVEGPDGNTDKTTIEFFDVPGLYKFLFHRPKTDTGARPTSLLRLPPRRSAPAGVASMVSLCAHCSAPRQASSRNTSSQRER